MNSILHITGWYPNELVPHEAPFIERHARALDPHTRNTVWHIDVRTGDRSKYVGSSLRADRTLLLVTRLRRWLIIEWLATILILWAWVTRDRNIPVDAINFHIAYPNCTRIRLLRWIVRRPMVITEHFSAYRIGYNAKSKGVARIKRIFHASVPVIVVSRSLEGDIERFAGPPAPTVHIVDNAVDTRIFHHDQSIQPVEGRFFAIAGWRSPKRPDLLLDALAQLRAEGLSARLRIAGIGPDSPAVEQRIATLGLKDHVDLLGHLDEHAVANEFRRAHALVHASDYETYSAVCAEALCCGTPVIASSVGGIPEFLLPTMGLLVPANTVEAWVRCWRETWPRALGMDREHIARTMAQRAGFDNVGATYYAVLRSVMGAGHRGQR